MKGFKIDEGTGCGCVLMAFGLALALSLAENAIVRIIHAAQGR